MLKYEAVVLRNDGGGSRSRLRSRLNRRGQKVMSAWTGTT